MPTPSMRDCSGQEKELGPGERCGLKYGRETLENSDREPQL